MVEDGEGVGEREMACLPVYVDVKGQFMALCVKVCETTVSWCI